MDSSPSIGVVPIIRALTAHGCKIAPGTVHAWARRAPSKRALWDTTVTEILVGYYEPTAERLMRANGWEGGLRRKKVRTT